MSESAPTTASGIDRHRPTSSYIQADGRQVVSYCDEPGVYFGPDGRPVTDKQAAEVGFDVKADTRARLVSEKSDALAQDLKDFEDGLEAKLNEELSASDMQKVDPALVKEMGGIFNPEHQLRETSELKMNHRGGALFMVFHKKSGKAMLNEKSRGDVCVKFMLDWHAQGGELDTSQDDETDDDAA